MNPFSVLVNPSHPLSADYVPENLIKPDIPFAGEASPTPSQPVPEKFLMNQTAAAYLELLLERGRSNNIHLYGVSGYRSYRRQTELYEESVKTKGAAHAAKYLALPGCSEHQTGLAMDLSIPSLNFELEEVFATTKEGKWLKQFAPLYGFIIRYPKGLSHITGYAYEPWHIRFVTKPLAIYLSKTHLTLEEYHSFSAKPLP